MNERHQVRAVTFECLCDPLGRNDLAHLGLDANRLRADPFDDRAHPLSEYTLYEY